MASQCCHHPRYIEGISLDHKKAIYTYDLVQYLSTLQYYISVGTNLCPEHKTEYNMLFGKILNKTITSNEFTYFQLTYHYYEKYTTGSSIKTQLYNTHDTRKKNFAGCTCQKLFIGEHKMTDYNVDSENIYKIMLMLAKLGFNFVSSKGKMIAIRNDTEITIIKTDYDQVCIHEYIKTKQISEKSEKIMII